MKRKIQRFFALLLVLTLIIGIVPATAYADGEAENDAKLPTLSKMFFSSVGYKATEDDARDITPKFSPDVREYTMTMLDSENPYGACMYAVLGDAAEESTEIEVGYHVSAYNADMSFAVTSGSNWGKRLSDIIFANSLKGNTLTIKIGPEGNTVKAYQVNIVRKATLSSLVIQDQDGNPIKLDAEFDRKTNTYTVIDPIELDAVLKVIPTATADEAVITVDGTTAESGREIQVSSTWNEDGTYTMPITVGGDGAESTQYSILFSKSTNDIEKIEISKMPEKTVYNIGEKFDPAGMMIKVCYADGTTKEISHDKAIISSDDALVKEESHIFVTYFGKTAEFSVTVSQGFKGDGTQDCPYELYTEQDLKTLDSLVCQGALQEMIYFKMMNDIVIQEEWNGIGDDDHPFYGDFDGNGFQLTIPEGGKAVFAKTRGAVIHDLKVYGARIDDYGLVSKYYVDKQAEYYVQFKRVTLVKGTQTLKSGFIGGYASGEDKILIDDCHVEEGVIIGYDKSQDHIGSFGGEFNGTIQNSTSKATVYGINWVGGIVGNQGQSMADFEILNCSFEGTVVATGNYVGGIAGGGYGGTGWGLVTAPNASGVTIKNCTNTGSITGGNAVGGIFGAEACVQQYWPNGIGYILDNRSTGTVKATNGNYVGGIIGFMQSLNKYIEISGNYYKNAEKGIGAVGHVDTSAVAGGYHDGTFYYDTSKDDLDTINMRKLQSYIELSTIGETSSGNNRAVSRVNYNREDDPLGADSRKLCYTDDDMEKDDLIENEGGSQNAEANKTSPNTGDDAPLGILFTAIMLSLSICAVIIKKRGNVIQK